MLVIYYSIREPWWYNGHDEFYFHFCCCWYGKRSNHSNRVKFAFQTRVFGVKNKDFDQSNQLRHLWSQNHVFTYNPSTCMCCELQFSIIFSDEPDRRPVSQHAPFEPTTVRVLIFQISNWRVLLLKRGLAVLCKIECNLEENSDT